MIATNFSAPKTLRLDKAVRQLAKTNRYRAAHTELRKIPGVGLLTAMTFLTEMGDFHRFHNRRQVAAYLGACPSSFESGQANDRKGRITRQGPSRLRKLLCQASWVAQRHCLETKQTYTRIRGGKSNRTKKAIVAVMCRLGIKMWHRALSCGVSSELVVAQPRGIPVLPMAVRPRQLCYSPAVSKRSDSYTGRDHPHATTDIH